MIDYQDRTNAPIDCPLKKSMIAWARCKEYRKTYKCLCKEARERLRLKGEGQEVFEQKLQEIRKPAADRPEGWSVDRLTRFYVIHNEHGELIHRATNQAECDDYLKLAAMVKNLEDENRLLWKLLEGELVEVDDPWDQVDQILATAADAAERAEESEAEADF
ncbi:MAG: hypothetical protein H0U74_15535 [Bradymonadaceae bacterium]|nr:hypothetical protein [Lujinxingiaceae bacterium]